MRRFRKPWKGRRFVALSRLFYLDRGIFIQWTSKQRQARGVSLEAFVGATQLICDLIPIDRRAAKALCIDFVGLLHETEPDDRLLMIQLLSALVSESPDLIPIAAQRLPALLRELDGESCARVLSETLLKFAHRPKEADAHLRNRISSSVSFASQDRRALLRRLSLYARAHANSDLSVRFGNNAAIDGLTLTLPIDIQGPEDEKEQIWFLLTALLGSHVSFGGFSLNLNDISGPWPTPIDDELDIERLHRAFSNPVLAADLFGLFEDKRIKLVLAQRYPGLGNRLHRLKKCFPSAAKRRTPASIVEQLMAALWAYAGDEMDGYALSAEAKPAYARICGLLDDITSSSSVLDSVKALLKAYEPVASLLRRDVQYRPLDSADNRPILNTKTIDAEGRRTELRARELWTKAVAVGLSLRLSEARDSIKSNYAEMSAFLDRMPPPEGGLVESSGKSISRENQSKLSEGTHVIQGGFCYPEWNALEEAYRDSWTEVTEYRPAGSDTHFVEKTLSTYALERVRLKRVFESLKPQLLRPERGLTAGEDLDFDRIVESRVGQKVGQTPSLNVFMNRRPKSQDNVIAFLLDLSSSTNAVATPAGKRIIDIQKEALLLISEAVAATGDCFAIYGYSGFGRDQVAFYVAKDFHDSWNQDSAARVGQLSWKMENRDGAAIRHCSAKLSQIAGKRKIMIHLSDGEPLDCGCSDYRDEYARADTKRALLEARQLGLVPFCITVDPYGGEYLDAIAGPGRYIILEDSPRLPEMLPKIISRLLR